MPQSSAFADFVVVGSGCAGAQAAQTLCEGGASVLMLDVGNQNTQGFFEPPHSTFSEIRRSDAKQSRYFLGKNFEGTVLEQDEALAALTPDRRYVTEGVAQYLPVSAKKFLAVESLALGGLGNVWGLGCHVFSAPELDELGMDAQKMQLAYSTICQRIGVSSPSSDIRSFMAGNVDHFQSELEVDENAKYVLKNYHRAKKKFESDGFFAGKPALALLTEKKETREPTQYRDMDFWDDLGQSAYRPRYTIEALKKHSHFTYQSHLLVLGFREHSDHVEVVGYNLLQGEQVSFKARNVILASSAFSTARIVLRSLGKETQKVPVVCNPFTFLGCLQPAFFGKVASARKTSLAQLAFFFDPDRQNFNAAMGAFFSTKSILLNNILKNSFFGFRDSLQILQAIQSAFVVVTLNHAEYPSSQKYVSLKPDSGTLTGDRLHVHYGRSEEEAQRMDRTEKKFKKHLRALGCFPFQTLRRPEGSSVHYAGTLPLKNGEEPLTTMPSGQLTGTKRVWIADGSAFRYLPAKGPTFSVMAWAHLVALNALGEKL